ncbi:thymidylate kinase-like isoform X2 [Photinus pyralis]|uniref:thymidylate kinase-like isoform X2 n=1 Tax=Photinus pyralis TaxID=7054 RepID=UPI0012671684|nr:thymidylate kinase-like isoform X2 [Photinus pyralis]
MCDVRLFREAKMGRGAFIVVEGIDRCGKTSQTIKLVESLRKKNIRVERMNFPDRTTQTGQVISHYLSDETCKLNDETIHLLFSANRWENIDRMKEKLSNGVSLIVDRYSYSGVAFSTAKGMSMKWCMQPEIGLLKPDLVLFLHINPETQSSRLGFGNERYENTKMQQTVSKIYDHFGKTEDNWKVISANGSFEEVHADLLSNIEEQIRNVVADNIPFKYFVDCGNVLNGCSNGHS